MVKAQASRQAAKVASPRRPVQDGVPEWFPPSPLVALGDFDVGQQ